MHELDRRSMLKVVAALSLVPHSALADEKDSTVHLVEAGTDRTGQPHKVARANTHLASKVLTRETNGALFIMENRNMVRGGPPRHIHYEQEEWFYFVVPSSKVTARVPRSPLTNSRIVAALVSRMHSMISLPPLSTTATEIVAWCTSMPIYFS